MGEESLGKINAEQIFAFSNDLVECLEDEKDANLWSEILEQAKLHLSQSEAEYEYDRKLLQEYQEKIVLSKKKAEEAKLEVAASAELDILEKELEEELQRERLLKEELRVITDEIGELEHERVSIDERRQILKKLKQDEQRAEMKLALYASVTNTIPNLDDDSKISGCIVEKQKEAVEYFELDSTKGSATPFDTCNRIWEMISPR